MARQFKVKVTAKLAEPLPVTAAPVVPEIREHGARPQVERATDPVTLAWWTESGFAPENILTETELESYQERAGIMEFDGGLSRAEAEIRAMDDVAGSREYTDEYSRYIVNELGGVEIMNPPGHKIEKSQKSEIENLFGDTENGTQGLPKEDSKGSGRKIESSILHLFGDGSPDGKNLNSSFSSALR